jgi:hypothetical protein
MHSAIRSMRSATRSAVAQSVRRFYIQQEAWKTGEDGRRGERCDTLNIVLEDQKVQRLGRFGGKDHGTTIRHKKTRLTYRPEHVSLPSLSGPTLPPSLVSTGSTPHLMPLLTIQPLPRSLPSSRAESPVPLPVVMSRKPVEF